MAYFNEKAKILEVSIEYDPDTDWSLGKGKIRFQSLDDALRIIGEMSGREVLKGASGPITITIPEDECKKHGLEAIPSKEPSKIVIREVPREAKDTDIVNICGQYGRISTIGTNELIGGNISIPYTTQEEANNAKQHLPLMQGQLKVIERAPAPFFEGNVPQTYEVPQNEYYSHLVPSHPPLEMIFIEYFTSNGVPYYYNVHTKLAQWESPPPDCYVIFNPVPRQEVRQNYSPIQSAPHTNEPRQSRASHGGVIRV